MGGNRGTEGKGGICKCEWEWGNRGKRYGDVKVGGRAGTEGRGRGMYSEWEWGNRGKRERM